MLRVNSKEIEPGDTFLALTGLKKDGHDYIEEAIDKGAVCIIATHGQYSVKTILTDDTRTYLSNYLKELNLEKLNKIKLIGIVGTSGKTITGDLTYQLLNNLNIKTAYIGTNGYEVYINNGSGYTDLGWTSNTTYTYNGNVSNGASFMVKSAYSIFKSNMSSGVTATINGGASTNNDSKNVVINGTDMTVKQYQDFVNAGNSLLVNNGGNSISSNLFTTTYYDKDLGSTTSITDVNSLDCTHSYTVKYILKGTTISYQRNLTPGCN